jgi:uncharacterized Zn finger protein (UPF0148 family)
MKVCEKCGEDFYGKDGDNICEDCEKKEIPKIGAARRRREKEAIYRSLGLVKVKGALGETFWE